jgi:hypothetical protein
LKRDLDLSHCGLPTGLPPVRAKVLGMEADGALRVASSFGEWLCDRLLTGVVIEPGDTVLVLPPGPDGDAVVLGRVGRAQAPRVELRAAASLTLACGDALLEMRADGKVLLKGDDVVLRAKGTQRIRAGNVAIN